VPRRDQIRMTDAEIRDFLRTHKTIILCSNGSDGVPHPMPMWFVADDDFVISMATFRGTQKILNLQRDPRVSLLVESGREYSQLKGVVIYGTAELSDDTDSIIATLVAASQKETAEADTGNRMVMDEGMKKTASKRILIRVKPDRIVSWDHSKLQGTY
jgi:PPOX class probable F420-dependent enzyme